MSTEAAPHTLFELSLLLIGLQKYGVNQSSFQKISKDFAQNDIINEESAYDAARFTPDLLQNLYLQVLKDEIRAASQYAAQQAKRKKSPTPPLQNLEEAVKHKHLLPGLAKRYHAKHIEQTIKEILEDEKAYDELVEGIELLKTQPQDGLPEKPDASAAQVESGANVTKITNGTNTRNQFGSLGTNGETGHSGQTTEELLGDADGIPPANGTTFVGSEQQVSDSLSLQAHSSAKPGTSPISHPNTPGVVPRPSGPLKAGLTAGPNTPSYLSTWNDIQQARGAQTAPPNTHSLPLQSYTSPGNVLSSTRPTGLPSQQSSYFGTFRSTPNNQSSTRGSLPATFTPLPLKLFGNLTPMSNFSERRRLQGLPPLNASQSSTKWKDPPRNLAREGRSPPRPGNSPYLSESPSPEPESRDMGRLSSTEANRAMDTPTRGRGRGRWSTRGRGRGGRLPAASPGARVRSQSALSGAEDSAAEGPGRKLKTEPPATPGFADEATSFVSTPGESRPGPRRREILRDGETPKPNLKRKRADTMDGTPEVHPAPKFSRPGQVLASRNFPRIVSALLNDINSHKLASVFAKPLTEKSAPGYLSLIYRPQDLKSIRSAISAGSRFIATIPDPEASQEEANGGDISAAATPSATTTKATNIWVDRTAEVVSPKGIVNSAQLEKELCRMLANAVMYNPDPKRGFGPHFRMTHPHQVEDDSDVEMDQEHDLDDGRLVNDAREMFHSVEQAVAAWRAAERINSGDTSFKAGNSEKIEDQSEDIAENTGNEDADGEKSSLRRSARG